MRKQGMAIVSLALMISLAACGGGDEDPGKPLGNAESGSGSGTSFAKEGAVVQQHDVVPKTDGSFTDAESKANDQVSTDSRSSTDGGVPKNGSSSAGGIPSEDGTTAGSRTAAPNGAEATTGERLAATAGGFAGSQSAPSAAPTTDRSSASVRSPSSGSLSDAPASKSR